MCAAPNRPGRRRQVERFPTIDESPEPHLVALVDLLGFSAALTNASAERRSKLRGLLMYISGLSGDFSVTPREVRAGTHPEFRGAVTGFSDTVVFSWPLDALRTNAIPTRSALAELQRKVCLIAGSARDAGVLVRGGITVGNLYHRNGVVIGEALIEAHELESRVANYPRILVSPRVLEHADFQLGATELMKDRDGLWCFDYIFMFFVIWTTQTLRPLRASTRGLGPSES